MEHNVILAGPTLDRALGLVRLGLLDIKPIETFEFNRASCTGTVGQLAIIRRTAPAELAPLLIPSKEEPVHLLVTNERDMHSGLVVQHLCRTALPDGSFVELCPGVLAPSWPLYYAMRCRELPRLSDRLLLGMELCGTYTHLIIGDQSTSTFFRQPSRQKDGSLSVRYDSPRISAATTQQQLSSFLRKTQRLRGVRPALEALKYLFDGSSSPGESILALMTSLPCKMGGYGFTGLELNPRVEVMANQRHLTRADSYHPDGYLRLLKTDLEYESNEHHTGAAAIARDKARRNDIQALGIEVKDVTWEMLSHLESLDLLFEQMLDKERRMGLDKRRQHLKKVHHPDNQALRAIRLQELLPPWPYEA